VSNRLSCRKLRARRPALDKSTIDSASCAITRNERARCERCEPVVRALASASEADGGAVAACSAGAIPKSSAQTSEIVALANSTTGLTPACSRPNTFIGASPTRSRTPQSENTVPSPPPISAMIRLSASTCRERRKHPEPSAERTANSRARAVPRASNRLLILAQAISSTQPTAPSRTCNVRVTVEPSM